MAWVSNCCALRHFQLCGHVTPSKSIVTSQARGTGMSHQRIKCYFDSSSVDQFMVRQLQASDKSID